MQQDRSRVPDQDTIRAWCDAAAQGDEDAVERLLVAHHARLAGFVARKIGVDWQGKIEADDVLQEAYVEVFAGIGGFTWQGEDSFYRWASRIVDHRFVDHVRHLRRKKRDVTREIARSARQTSRHDTLLDRCLQDFGTASRAIRRDDALAAMMSCLARLPDDDREIIERHYLREEPFVDIATALDRSPDAVRRHAARAMDRLNRCLGRASRYLSMG